MKLPGFLNKPRWQAKEPDVRRAGVAEDDDAELVANLSRIAREDSDAGVRSAALKRLADPALTQRIAHEDTDAGVRADARRLWFDLLAGTHARAPSPPECARLLRAQDDAALIEHVARAATDAALRGSALSRVTRVALLADRATSDPSPELRRAALERIEDAALLERLAERTRKTDKRISRLARERADAVRIAKGDATVADSVARGLCERSKRSFARRNPRRPLRASTRNGAPSSRAPAKRCARAIAPRTRCSVRHVRNPHRCSRRHRRCRWSRRNPSPRHRTSRNLRTRTRTRNPANRRSTHLKKRR